MKLTWSTFLFPIIILALSWFSSKDCMPDDWYWGLAKSSLNPPGYVFGIVWPILYTLMGFAVAIVWQNRKRKWAGFALSLFVFQLLLNFAWSPIFFCMHEIDTAFYLLLSVVASVLVTIIMFLRVSSFAAVLLVPYLMWVCFASYLSYEIYQSNMLG